MTTTLPATVPRDTPGGFCQHAGRFLETAVGWLGGALLDHLGSLGEHVRGDGEAEGLGCLEVDDEVEAHRLLDGEVSRLGAFENLIYVGSCTVVHVQHLRAIPGQASGFRVESVPVHCRQPLA